MKDLNGISIKNLNILHRRKGDLLYYEGPLLSLYEGDDERQYLLKWVDANDTYNRWLSIPVTNQQLLNFLTKEISLKELILNAKPNLAYLLDIDNQLKVRNLTTLLVSKIHKDYLPPVDSYYDEEQYQEYAQKLLNTIIDEQNRAKKEELYDTGEEVLSTVREPQKNPYKKKVKKTK